MLIVSIVVFQLLVFVALILLFRKIMTQNVASATKHIDELNEEYVKKDAESSRQLEDARRQAQEIISKAEDEAAEVKVKMLEQMHKDKEQSETDARTHAQEIIAQAEKSRQQLLAELDERIRKEAVKQACGLIEGALPLEFKQLVHTHWVGDLVRRGFKDLERLRIPEDVVEVKVVTAFPLTKDEQSLLSDKLQEALHRKMALKEEIDPKVVAGFIMHFGSLVIDGSLQHKIQEKAR